MDWNKLLMAASDHLLGKAAKKQSRTTSEALREQDEQFVSGLNKIQNAQIDARKMTLYPFWYRNTKGQTEPLTEEMFNKYISLPPRIGPPYVTGGIKNFGKWFYGSGTQLPLRGLKRRPKMRAKLKREIKELIKSKIDEAQRQHWGKWHGSTELYINGVEIEFHTFLELLLNHLGITLERTPGKTKLVSVKKKRSRKAHKSKKSK